MIAAGRSDDEIKRDLVRRYSPRILAMPEGARGQWLVWATPVVTVSGMLLTIWFIRRSFGRDSIQPQTALPELPGSDWY